MVSNGIQEAFTRDRDGLRWAVEGESEGHEDYEQERARKSVQEDKALSRGKNSV